MQDVVPGTKLLLPAFLPHQLEVPLFTFQWFLQAFQLDHKFQAQSAAEKNCFRNLANANEAGEHLQSSTRHMYSYFIFKCFNKEDNLFLIKLALHFPP